MSFQLLTEDELESIGVISGQNSIYFDSKTGLLDTRIGYNFVEEVIDSTKTKFIIKYENTSSEIQNIYAIMHKTVYSGEEYSNLSSLYSAYKLYKKV